MALNFERIKFSKIPSFGDALTSPVSSRCKTDLDDLIILDGRLEHDHAEPDRRNIERQRVRQACKRKTEDEHSERPSKLIKEIEKGGVNELVTQDITSVRQAMYRQRRKTQPTLPTLRTETIETLTE
jgi:hypothetical protein